MQKRRKIRILTSIILIVTIMFLVSNVYADINWDYYNKSVSSMTVVDANLDSKVSGSSLLSALGLLIYSIASLMEWILGSLYKLITGTNIFPWADAILFNAIPLLDINFINPAQGVSTLVETLQGFLSTMYSTLFGLAITFFAVAVMVMAIKLLITTIASEKAKYKEALVQWGIGLLLMFTIHYGISFVFYLNENLVNVASNMVIPELQRAEDKINALSQSSAIDKAKAVDIFIDAMETKTINDWLSLGLSDLFTTYTMHNLDNDYDKAKEYIRSYPEVTFDLLQQKKYTNERFGEGDWYQFDLSNTANFWNWGGGDKAYVKVVADDVYEIVNNDLYWNSQTKENLYAKIQNGTASDDEIREYEYCQVMTAVRDAYKSGSSGAINYSIISNISQLFKEASWTTSTNSWRADSVVIQYALLYAILVVQSLILFISYAKRLFYIIMLAMLAPIVVAFDFFNKSLGNGKGVLSVWLKEFCQLVFIQTLQAFIYAILLILIVNLLVNGNASGMNQEDYNTGLGLMSVIALVSVFKIEDLVRKIFGFGPTRADHGRAIASIAKTAFALKLGSRVLDNGKKIITGAGKSLKTRKEAKSANEEMQEEVDVQREKLAAGKITDKEYERNIKKLQRENKKKLSEIKARRNEGIKSMASGVLETGGAIYGGTAGAIIGGADGDIDEATRGLLYGVGIGDTIGKAAVDVADFGISTVVIKGGNAVADKYSSGKKSIRNVSKDYKAARAEGEAFSKALKESLSKEYKQHFRQMEQFEKNIKNLENLYNKKVEDIE